MLSVLSLVSYTGLLGVSAGLSAPTEEGCRARLFIRAPVLY
jgi:hypothetical protein